MAGLTALSPLMLQQHAVAQVPTFHFHGSRNSLRECGHGLISIRDVKMQDPDMIRIKAVMQDLPQGLLSCDDTMDFIVDSGASKTSTFDSKDFVPGMLKLFDKPPVLTGIAGVVEIKGEGEIKFQLIMDDGNVKEITTQAYWIPDMKCRLFSPQSFFEDSEQQSTSDYKFVVERGSSCFRFGEGLNNQITLQMDSQTKLHQFRGYRTVFTTENAQALKACVEDDVNKNLSQSQKLWYKTHCKLGHRSFKQIQFLARRGWLGAKAQGTLSKTIEVPHCAACIMGKQAKQPSGVTSSTTVKSGNLERQALNPGQIIYSDQFSVRVKGRGLPAHSGIGQKDEYSGGTVFYDAASKFLCVELQVGYTAIETIKSKLRFERMAADAGIRVHAYHTDNGIYQSDEFLRELQDKGQGIKMSGVSAQFQNGAAEAIIKSIVQSARTMMLHANLRWPEVADESLWPYALQYAVYLHNIMPTEDTGLSPVEIWTRTKSNHNALLHAHAWGCPAYVLSPKLRDGGHLPKWEPRSRRGQFMGFSPIHASSVGMIRNLSTHYVSPQFHVMYDDQFETVHSHEGNPPPQEVWERLYTFNRFQVDWDIEPPDLAVEWLSPGERFSYQEQQLDSRLMSPVSVEPLVQREQVEQNQQSEVQTQGGQSVAQVQEAQASAETVVTSSTSSPRQAAPVETQAQAP